jgi:UDP-N-acetylmuramyl pentapeptide phosphotransferase/UDP-N-acetylglucosamine-1-phosphate transferase
MYAVDDLDGIFLGMLIVGVISFFDDCYSIAPVFRLIAHATAAVVIIYSGFYIHRLELPGISWDWPYGVGVALSVLFVIWMINLYNFMDGMDGFAGGMAMFGFGTFAVMAAMAHNNLFLVVNLIIVSASAGFLIFNFPPARIFMGDVGSSTLGLLAATLSLWGARDDVFPFWVALLVFSPFIMDASVTLLRRMLRRERIWNAHKTHYYQKLVQAGWGHRTTVLIEYIVMFACGITALWIMDAPAEIQVMAVACWLLFYFLFFRYVARIMRRNEAATL